MNKKFCVINCTQTEVEKFRNLFEENSEFSFIGVSYNYNDSLTIALKLLPDIILINIDEDTEAENNSSFNLVRELYQYLDYSPAFIALSSSKDKAYEVFKLGFFDYFLKPINELDIRRCIFRLKKNFKKSEPEKICLKSYSDYRFIELDLILYLEADNNSTDFYLKNDNRVSAFKPLKFYEELLPKNFLRVHNSFVVNTDYLVRINFAKSRLSLNGYDKRIPFSRSHKEQIEKLRESLFSSTTVHA